MEERLHKIIARSGLTSRRRAEQLIQGGRVKVDGIVVTELGTKVEASKSDIRLDGVRVRADRPRRYILLNKPAGYVTTRSDPRGRPTVMDLLPPSLRTLFPVGRLDMASSGLLLLTDDGDFAQRMAHPRYGVTKTYRIRIRGFPDQKVLRRAERGVRVDGQWLRADSVERLPEAHQTRSKSLRGRRTGVLANRGRATRTASARESSPLRVVLREGRNREIVRLFRALGHPVQDLHREKIGFLAGKGLKSGGFRRLEPVEVVRLLRGKPGKGGAGAPRRRGPGSRSAKTNGRPVSRGADPSRRRP